MAEKSVVEAVARAILGARLSPNYNTPEFIDENWHKFADEARAAIKALSENVTDETLKAFDRQYFGAALVPGHESVRRALSAAISSAGGEG